MDNNQDFELMKKYTFAKGMPIGYKSGFYVAQKGQDIYIAAEGLVCCDDEKHGIKGIVDLAEKNGPKIDLVGLVKKSYIMDMCMSEGRSYDEYLNGFASINYNIEDAIVSNQSLAKIQETIDALTTKKCTEGRIESAMKDDFKEAQSHQKMYVDKLDKLVKADAKLKTKNYDAVIDFEGKNIYVISTCAAETANTGSRLLQEGEIDLSKPTKELVSGRCEDLRVYFLKMKQLLKPKKIVFVNDTIDDVENGRSVETL